LEEHTYTPNATTNTIELGFGVSFGVCPYNMGNCWVWVVRSAG